MRGKNARCRIERPIDTRTDTGGRTTTWSNLPEFSGSVQPLTAVEAERWERKVESATYRLIVMGRAIPEMHHDKVVEKNRVVLRNRRNALSEEVFDIIGVKKRMRAGRIRQFEIILGEIK